MGTFRAAAQKCSQNLNYICSLDKGLRLAPTVGPFGIFLELQAVFVLLLLPDRLQLDCHVSGLLGSGPKRVNDLCFLIYGEFFPPPPSPPSPLHPTNPKLQTHVSFLRPISQPQGTNPSFEADIWALGLGFGP